MSNLQTPFSNRPLSDWISQLQQASDPEQRLNALQAIGLLAAPADQMRWAGASLGDSDATVRALAAKSLGSVQSPLSEEMERQLVSLLTDNDPDVRFESARALIRRKSVQAGQSVAVLLAFLDEAETHALMIAAVINSLLAFELDAETANAQLRPRLLKWLDHDRAEVREAVSTAFAKWPEMASSCRDRLLPLLDDSEPVVREKIAETFGLAGIASEEIRSALKVASEDEDAEVARVATEALHKLGGAGH